MTTRFKPLLFSPATVLAVLLPAALMAGGSRDADALIQEAARAGGLGRSTSLLRRAMRLGRGGFSGADAALELAKLDYAAGRFRGALGALDRARDWPRAEGLRPGWLYWGGQTRLALKQWGPAVLNFRDLLAGWPGDANADAARLGEADALAAQRRYAPAQALYQGLLGSKSAFSAQALWGLGVLAREQGRGSEATGDFQRLLQGYPASFEAQAAPGHGAPPSAHAAGPGPAVVPSPAGGRWSVQVGAFSQLRWARDLVLQLKRRRYRVQVYRREILGRWLYLVQVGPYPDGARAAAVAGILSTRDNLPFKLVQE